MALILCLGLQQAAAQMQLPPLPVDKNASASWTTD